MSTLYSAGLINQLGDALENAGFTPDEVTALSGYSNLALLKGLLIGHAEIRPLLHFIDCDRDPFMPEGWTVQEHSKDGQLEWNAQDVHLFLTRQQQTGKLDGSSLHRELKNAATLTACSTISFNILTWFHLRGKAKPSVSGAPCIGDPMPC